MTLDGELIDHDPGATRIYPGAEAVQSVYTSLEWRNIYQMYSSSNYRPDRPDMPHQALSKSAIAAGLIV
jgi:hypothetical protein